MAILQRDNEEEESGELKNKGQATEEFKAGIQGIEEIKEEWEPIKKMR